MYVKPSRKQVRGVYVPENYNGTAFDEPAHSEQAEEPTAPQESAPQTDRRDVAAILTASEQNPAPGGGLLSLFSGFGGLRSDDILLLALILLLSRSDKDGRGASDVLPLLAILLFIG